jgi:hypothetical protein
VKVWPLSILLVAASQAALGCSPPPQKSTHELFWPSQSPAHVDDKFPRLPAVVIESVEFERAADNQPKYCTEPVGSLRLKLHWPGNRAFPLAKMGFYFRVTSGSAPPGIFPREPLALLKVAGDRAELLFTWPEDSLLRQKPMSFTFEIIPIDAWLHLGPSVSRAVP